MKSQWHALPKHLTTIECSSDQQSTSLHCVKQPVKMWGAEIYFHKITCQGPSIIINIFPYEQNSRKGGGGSKGLEKCWFLVITFSGEIKLIRNNSYQEGYFFRHLRKFSIRQLSELRNDTNVTKLNVCQHSYRPFSQLYNDCIDMTVQPKY